MTNEELKARAIETRALYRSGKITRDEAMALIKPYAEAFNKKSAELAKKYNRRPMRFSFAAFMR